mgnify:FL=1
MFSLTLRMPLSTNLSNDVPFLFKKWFTLETGHARKPQAALVRYPLASLAPPERRERATRGGFAPPKITLSAPSRISSSH